jgi:hypothetical protein
MGAVIPPKLTEEDIAWARVLYERVGHTNAEIAEKLSERGLVTVTANTVQKWASKHGWVRNLQAAVHNRTGMELAKAMQERDGLATKRARELGQEVVAYDKQVMEDLRAVYPEGEEDYEIARQKMMAAGSWTDSQIETWVRTAALDRAGKILAHRAEWGQMDEIRGQALALVFAYIAELKRGSLDQGVLKIMHGSAARATDLVGKHIKMLAEKQNAESETYGLHTDDPTGGSTFEERLKAISERASE